MQTSLSTFLREPLLHFSLIAAFIFFIHYAVGGDKKEIIFVDAVTQNFLINQEQELLLRQLTAQERTAIIDSFIEEEILVREARKRGFSDNSRVRALLIQNMRFFLRETVPEPGERELQDHFKKNIDTFKRPASVSYDQVLYIDPDEVPDNIVNDLRSGVDFSTMGDRLTIGSSISIKAVERNIIDTFGPTAAKSILAISDNDWHGPFESSLGVHFLRIQERRRAVQPKYDDVKEWVGLHWNMSKHRELLDAKLEEIKKGYSIEVESVLQGDSSD